MTSKKKKIGNGLFLAAVFILTIYSVFHGEDLHAVLKAIVKVNPWYLLPAVWGVIVYMGRIHHYSLHAGHIEYQDKEEDLFPIFLYRVLFSCITPSASGGQPMQIYYMRKNKIPIPVATIVLMIVTITYKSVLVFIGLFVAFFQRGFVHKYLEGILPVFYLGVMHECILLYCHVSSGFVPFPCQIYYDEGSGDSGTCADFQEKEERTRKLEESMNHYTVTSDYLKGHGKVIVHVLLLTFLQRFALFL